MAFWLKLILYVVLAIFSHYFALKTGEYRKGGDGGPFRSILHRLVHRDEQPQPSPHPRPAPSGTRRPLHPFRHEAEETPDVSRIGG